MTPISRRDFVGTSAGLAAGAAVGVPLLPKRRAYRDPGKLLLPNGWSGSLASSLAAAMADFIVVDMVAQAASGSTSVEDAVKQAERCAKRYYR